VPSPPTTTRPWQNKPAAWPARTPFRPAPELLSAVCRYLDERRLLGAEVYVAGPNYRQISVEARLEAEPYVSPDQLLEDVNRELERHLDPLGRQKRDTVAPASSASAAPSATPEHQDGWAFGEDLHPTSLYGVMLKVKGVHSVKNLSLIVDGRPHDNIQEPVQLKPYELVYGGDHMLVVVPMEDR
jgi:hypothetical protein